MLNLAMISILNRPHELKAHIKGALTNGVSRDEIREIFMQVAIYAGVPAGVDSFRIAREVFAGVGQGLKAAPNDERDVAAVIASEAPAIATFERHGLLRCRSQWTKHKGIHTMEIGFIGLGKMGFPMARRLIEAGHQLTVFDTRKEAVDKLVALGRGGRIVAKGHRRPLRDRAWRACRRCRPRSRSRPAPAA